MIDNIVNLLVICVGMYGCGVWELIVLFGVGFYVEVDFGFGE